MKIINNKLIISISLISVLICSCATYVTIEFIEEKTAKKESINGWIIEPDIFSIRGSSAKFTKEQLNRFFVSMKAIKNKEKSKTDIVDINFENISVLLKPSNEIIPISLSYICCVSYPSLKYIKKAYDYSLNQYKSQRITIPEDIDTIVLNFDAVFYNGVLSTKENLTVKFDHIIVNDSTPIERIPVAIEMYRKVSSSKGIRYGD